MLHLTEYIEDTQLELIYVESFLALREADQWLEECRETLPWQQLQIKLMGKEIPQPRLTAWYSDPGVHYTYSGLTLHPTEWHPLMQELRERVEEFALMTFNSALLNYYRDGQDSMGFHADNEPELGRQPVIASFSLGGPRRFVFKHRQLKKKHELSLAHGSLLLMKGETQHHWVHGIPKTKKHVNERMNITFRKILPHPLNDSP